MCQVSNYQDGKPVRIGWVFTRDTDNPEFDPDDPEMGLHTLHVETWVTVHNAPPTTKYNYFSFDDAVLRIGGVEETCHDYCIIT